MPTASRAWCRATLTATLSVRVAQHRSFNEVSCGYYHEGRPDQTVRRRRTRKWLAMNQRRLRRPLHTPLESTLSNVRLTQPLRRRLADVRYSQPVPISCGADRQRRFKWEESDGSCIASTSAAVETSNQWSDGFLECTWTNKVTNTGNRKRPHFNIKLPSARANY